MEAELSQHNTTRTEQLNGSSVASVLSFLVGSKVPPPPPQPKMGFFTDTSLCIGCKACEVACKQWNQLPAKDPVWTGSSYDNTTHLSAIAWRHVQFIEEVGRGRPAIPLLKEQFAQAKSNGTIPPGTALPFFNSERWLMRSDVCKHCANAPCQEAPASTLHKLDRLEWVAILVELTGILTFLRNSGRAARPLVGTAPKEQGTAFWSFVFGSGLLLPWLMKTLSMFSRRSHGIMIGVLPSLLVLVGGYFLRRTIVEAGHTSSQDARTTLWNAKRNGRVFMSDQ